MPALWLEGRIWSGQGMLAGIRERASPVSYGQRSQERHNQRMLAAIMRIFKHIL